MHILIALAFYTNVCRKNMQQRNLCVSIFSSYVFYISPSLMQMFAYFIRHLNPWIHIIHIHEYISIIILTAPSQPTKVGIVTLQFVTLYQQKHLKHQQQKHVVDSMPGHQTMSSICIYVTNCHSPTQSFNVKYSTNFPFIFNTH